MKVVFFASDKPRERILADAFGEGVKLAGDEFAVQPLVADPEPADADVVCMVGVKSRKLFRMHQDRGTHVIYLDKGYLRAGADSPVKLWEYWRVALDDHQPTKLMEKRHDSEARRDEAGLAVSAWRKKGNHILLAGSSLKYHEFYGLRHPTEWAGKLVKQLRGYTDREIIYRPKPSWSDATPIPGATFHAGGSTTILEDLANCHVLVTHGSNAVFEAQIAGVPTLTLGPAVSRPISSCSQDAVESPYLATYEERYRWLNNLMWWQWTMAEMASGQTWKFLKPQIYGA